VEIGDSRIASIAARRRRPGHYHGQALRNGAVVEDGSAPGGQMAALADQRATAATGPAPRLDGRAGAGPGRAVAVTVSAERGRTVASLRQQRADCNTASSGADLNTV
jgi:hypothetical protein